LSFNFFSPTIDNISVETSVGSTLLATKLFLAIASGFFADIILILVISLSATRCNED